jgi:uncharacterized membrane protein YphA (DoxX/SURF4 family)
LRVLGGLKSKNMSLLTSVDRTLTVLVAPVLGSAIVRWIALLGLCAAYLQGGLNKLLDFPAAIAEMRYFGLSPPGTIAILSPRSG